MLHVAKGSKAAIFVVSEAPQKENEVPEDPLSFVKVLLKFRVESVGTLGDHEKRWQYQIMTLSVGPTFMVMPTKRSSDPREKTSTTPSDSGCVVGKAPARDAYGKLYLSLKGAPNVDI